jgi:ornithine cyclodeaminase/alanine dehydrogenase-like protein (mu-crystallin family)
MALIGNGAQAEFQALAMKAVVGIDTIHLYDIDRRATDKALRNLRGSCLKVVACASVENAVEGAQIITTAKRLHCRPLQLASSAPPGQIVARASLIQWI